MASTSGKDNEFMSSGEFVRHSSSILSFQPWMFMKGNPHGGDEKSKIHRTYSDPGEPGHNYFVEKSCAEILPRNVRLGFGHRRSQNVLNTRRASRYLLRSISPVESSLISQWYDDKLGVEDYTFTTIPSSTAYARPLVIFDGPRIISRSSAHQTAGEGAIEEEVAGVASNFVNDCSSVSHLPRLRTPKRKSRETQHDKLYILSPRRPRKTFDYKGGLEVIRIFSVGLAIGAIFTILLTRKEVMNLNDLLRSKESLIQDLQEDLEMKESLIVKELDVEACSQNTDGANARMEVHYDYSENHVSASDIPTMSKNVQLAPIIPEIEAMSKMEEELKAELERLDMNTNIFGPDAKISAIKDLDPDLTVDVVHGELKVGPRCNKSQVDDDSTDIDSRSTSTNHTYNANYVVSPRELSLRLHEVIQFRLEERIRELEQTLQLSQNQLETEHNFSMRAFSNSKIGSSSKQESPTSARDHTFTQPFFLNLHGGAVDAYDEAYEEFTRIADDENLQLTTNTSNLSEYSLYSSDRSLVWGMEGEKCFKGDLTFDKLYKDGSLHAQEYHKKGEDECDEQYDDECKMLIQQILERTKQGSSAVMHAQRMLFSMDK